MRIDCGMSNAFELHPVGLNNWLPYLVLLLCAIYTSCLNVTSRIYSLLILAGRAMPAKTPNINGLQYMQVTGVANLGLVTVKLPLNWLFCIQLNLCFSRGSVYGELSFSGGSVRSPEQSVEQENPSSSKQD